MFLWDSPWKCFQQLNFEIKSLENEILFTITIKLNLIVIIIAILIFKTIKIILVIIDIIIIPIIITIKLEFIITVIIIIFSSIIITIILIIFIAMIFITVAISNFMIYLARFNASWEMEAAFMNIFSSDHNLDKRDSTDNSNCFIILGRWFDSLWM